MGKKRYLRNNVQHKPKIKTKSFFNCIRSRNLLESSEGQQMTKWKKNAEKDKAGKTVGWGKGWHSYLLTVEDVGATSSSESSIIWGSV